MYPFASKATINFIVISLTNVLTVHLETTTCTLLLSIAIAATTINLPQAADNLKEIPGDSGVFAR